MRRRRRMRLLYCRLVNSDIFTAELGSIRLRELLVVLFVCHGLACAAAYRCVLAAQQLALLHGRKMDVTFWNGHLLFGARLAIAGLDRVRCIGHSVLCQSFICADLVDSKHAVDVSARDDCVRGCGELESRHRGGQPSFNVTGIC